MRKDDTTEKKVFRTVDRFFQANGHWYFSAREGDIGPFRSRERAREEAQAYIRARTEAPAAEPARGRTDGRGIPTYVYRCILSMEEPVNQPRELVIDMEQFD
jgi:hypothetical protein